MRAVLAVVSVVASACALACSDGAAGRSMDPAPAPVNNGDADAGTAPPTNEPMVTLQIMPGATHSGFDGVHTYRVPVAIYGSNDATLVASDPSVVDVAPATLVDTSQDNGKYFLVTTKKAGTVTLTASAHGSRVSATLTILPYTVEQWSTGEQRYMNAASSGPPCVQCHSANGGIDHSPSMMASAADGDIVSVITTGVLVEGNPITQVRHKWAVSSTEAEGLVTYLRSLAPRGFAGGS